MNNKLYVGNLNYAVTQQDLTDFFMTAGAVLESIVIIDRGTGNSRGFGFVTMSSEMEALDAIEQLNEHELLSWKIKIKLALAREARFSKRLDSRFSSGKDKYPLWNFCMLLGSFILPLVYLPENLNW
tara:strand:- start:4153 stop:4533 length:381 start_codon:yes stop_codon:yes gene_type:complete